MQRRNAHTGDCLEAAAEAPVTKEHVVQGDVASSVTRLQSVVVGTALDAAQRLVGGHSHLPTNAQHRTVHSGAAARPRGLHRCLQLVANFQVIVTVNTEKACAVLGCRAGRRRRRRLAFAARRPSPASGARAVAANATDTRALEGAVGAAIVATAAVPAVGASVARRSGPARAGRAGAGAVGANAAVAASYVLAGERTAVAWTRLAFGAKVAWLAVGTFSALPTKVAGAVAGGAWKAGSVVLARSAPMGAFTAKEAL